LLFAAVVLPLALEGDARSSGGTSDVHQNVRHSSLFAGDRLIRTTRRWAKVVVLGMIAGGVIAFAVSKVMAPEYRATAQLYLAPAANPTVSVQDVVAGQSLARSYVQLANANIVLRSAMDRVGWKDLKTFRDRATISQIRDTSIITVSFRHGDPQFTADATNAIADAFTEQARSLQTTLQGSAVQQLDEQIQSLQEDLKNVADSQRQTKQQTLAQLLKTRDDMRLASARAQDTVSLWEAATPPIEPDSPKVALNTLLGVLIAGLLMVLVIALVSYIEDRVSDFDAMHDKLGITPLAEILASTAGDSFDKKLYVRDAPMSFEAEAFRGLRTSILFASPDRRPRTILVTSALPYEGKSVVSANLALAFAQAGSPTVLVDADLRRPSQHRLFAVDPSRGGLTTLLTSNDFLADLAFFEVAPNLAVLPTGPVPPDPAEFLGSARMTSLLHALANRGPDATVIVDTSPTLAVADAMVLATKVDACLIVVDSARTRTASALRAVESLRRVHARIIGGVVNKVRTAPAGYYGYYGESDSKTRKERYGRRFVLARWLVVPFLGLAIVGTSAFFSRAGLSETPTAPRSATALARASEELTAARSAWEGSKDVLATRGRLESADAYLAQATDSGANPQRLTELAQEITKLRAQVDGASVKTSMLVDIGKSIGATGATQLVLSGSDVYALDRTGQKILKVATNGAAAVAAEKGQGGMGAPKRLAAVGQLLFVMDDGGRIYWLGKDGPAEIKLAQKRYRDPVAFAVYSDAIFVLDGETGQLWEYDPDANGNFRDAVAILPAALQPGTARDLAVDGDFWIVTSDAQLLRFARAAGSSTLAQVPFNIRWTADAARPIQVQARAEDTAVYLLDDRARRFFAVARDGREIARVGLPAEFSRPTAFAVMGDVLVTAHDTRLQKTQIPK
jgi:capsular exopolysaccharide synthesis family protein